MAGGIELLGDNPWGWRIGSIIFGLIAIGAFYDLVRAAGGSPWLGVGAAAVMAAGQPDGHPRPNSHLGHLLRRPGAGRRRSDVRGWALASGIMLGVAACMKLVALDLIPALVLLKALVVLWARGRSPGIRPRYVLQPSRC